MSALATGSSAQPTPAGLRLTNVTVTFLADRPKTKIKLTIKLDGKDHVVEIDKGTVEWSGTIRGIEGAKITICIERRSRAHIAWRDFAVAEALLTKDPPAIFDVAKTIMVTLTVDESSDHGPLISDVADEVAAAKAKVTDKNPIVDKLSPILRVLKIIVIIGDPLKDIHPAVKLAVGGIDVLIKLCEMQTTCREEALDLVEQLMSFLPVEEHVDFLTKRAETRRAVGVMLQLISDTSKYIHEKTSTGVRGMIGDLIGTEYKAKIAKLKAEFGRAKESFDRSVQLEIFVAVGNIEMITEAMFLETNLSACQNAHFRSDGDCLEGTRTALRQHIKEWIDDTSQDRPNLYWLFGNAGSGKSTVANTVAKMVEDSTDGQGLSCFFCRRDDTGLSNPRRLLPTLAFRFAQQHESYRAAVMKLLRTPRGAGIATTVDIKTQYQRLFEELLIQTVDPLRQHVVVVDGFDECGSSKEQEELATYILALSRAVPWVKVFITSRNEPAIRNIFLQATSSTIPCNINSETDVDDDIRLYIKSQAEDLVISLSEDNVRTLVERAAGLFIWCKTLFEYLRQGLGARRLLMQILSGKDKDDSSQPWGQLYVLYDTILDSAIAPRESDVSFMRALLSIINIATSNRPLSAKAIVSFLHRQEQHMQFEDRDAENVIKKLHAVLYMDTAADGGVRAHHNSFYDFLQWKASTDTSSGWETVGAINRLLAQSCLKTLHQELRFNVCKIDRPILNNDIPDLAARISKHMPETLRYSSRFWFTHFLPSTLGANEAESAVLELLQSVKLLFWLECSSLEGYLRQIQFTFRQCMKRFFESCPAIIAAVEDACRFVSSFADAMDSIPHIYLSALWWLPESSLMYRNLGLSKRASWNMIRYKPKNWDPLVWGVRTNVESVALSPDGRFVAISNGLVCIRDLQTGALVAWDPLPEDPVETCSLAYSPDGCFIATGSTDNAIRILDATSWDVKLGPLTGHSYLVHCIAYTPNGLFIVSGSDDGTIRIWSAQTGELQCEHVARRRNIGVMVYAVAYSPNGRFIAATRNDQPVRVWDASLHEEAVGLESLYVLTANGGIALNPNFCDGHEDGILSVAYSPDGCTIVSGLLDHTIRVWDVQTGEAIGEPLRGHHSGVTSIAYSPDGHFILSGSEDGQIHLWDAASRTPIGEMRAGGAGKLYCVSYSPDGSLIVTASFAGVYVWDTSTSFVVRSHWQPWQDPSHPTGPPPFQTVNTVAYSPDGRFIASGSDFSDLICICDTQTGAAMGTPVMRHPGLTTPSNRGSVQSIAYSRDGRFIASGSANGSDSTVCVLDARTGAVISGPLRGHSSTILSVAYSPDGDRVASASCDSTVRLWDVKTGAGIGEPLQVGYVSLSVAFSPDGSLVACGTLGGYIWIWDAHTRAPIRDPIQVPWLPPDMYPNAVTSVVFSPDGRHIASGSIDCSVQIWDAQTGEALGGRFRGNQKAGISCVAYSPDGRFIASSSMGNVLVWDVQSGLVCAELLRGHPNGPGQGISSVAFSPDGRFLACGVDGGTIYVCHAPNYRREDIEARWQNSCTHIDLEGGWIKDGEALLLWVPAFYRKDIQSAARVVFPKPNLTAYNINYESLFRYSGRNWVDISSGFDE